MLRRRCETCVRSIRSCDQITRSGRVNRRRFLATSADPSTALEVTDPLVLYQNLVAAGKVQWDEEQVRTLLQLKKVHTTLVNYEPSQSLKRMLASSPSIKESTSDDTGSLANRILPNLRTEKSLVKALTHEDDLSMLDTPTGFLLTGSVGTGKTMLLDIFYRSLPVRKQRIHYHAFLLGLYRKVFVALEDHRVQMEAEEREMQRLAQQDPSRGYPWSRREENKAIALSKGWRQVFAGGRKFDDTALVKEYVLAKIAVELMEASTVLAFDEIQLVDVAGAGIIRRVLTWYWRLGGVVIGTSNRLPSDLYQQGVQQEQFQSFLTTLQDRCPVYQLRSDNDWRRRERANELYYGEEARPSWSEHFIGSSTWFTETKKMAELAHAALPDGEGEPKLLKVYGRSLQVPLQINQQVARFSFADLCQKELGPADYLTITSTYPTVIVDNIPQLKLNAKNEARRFITFIDAAYEAKTRLICSAAAEPDNIFFPDATSLLDAFKDGDAMIQETLGEISQDLIESFRPNISAYRDDSAEAKREASKITAPSNSPVLSNLAIFTGQDEQFAYKRALSRIFEMTSKEYVKTAKHTPIPYEERVWEHPKPFASSVGPITPTPPKPQPASQYQRGVKMNPLDPEIDVGLLPKPNIATTHFWGMVENWGKAAGRWGMGTRAPGLTDHETRRQEQQERLRMMEVDRKERKGNSAK